MWHAVGRKFSAWAASRARLRRERAPLTCGIGPPPGYVAEDVRYNTGTAKRQAFPSGQHSPGAFGPIGSAGRGWLTGASQFGGVAVRWQGQARR